VHAFPQGAMGSRSQRAQDAFHHRTDGTNPAVGQQRGHQAGDLLIEGLVVATDEEDRIGGIGLQGIASRQGIEDLALPARTAAEAG